jgi:hypothetical protein
MDLGTETMISQCGLADNQEDLKDEELPGSYPFQLEESMAMLVLTPVQIKTHIINKTKRI